MAFRRVACTTALLLAAIARAQNVVPSNDTTGVQSYRGTIELQDQKGQNISRLVPITRSAVTNNALTGNLYYTNADNVANLVAEDIAYISCSSSDYPGNLDASSVFKLAYYKNITAILLYSTGSEYCNYTDVKDPLQDFRIFSMTSAADSQKVLNETDNLGVSAKYFVSIARSTGSGGQDTSTNGQQNPLGPSPSTAVAMIILYSITGIITALFLVIIITGAVRAHRHPDRYGPRDVLGRPRQSRARGLGRAILDTIPIVKFGQNEPPKPTDVELGATAVSREATAANAEPRSPTEHTANENISTDQAEFQRNAAVEQPSGIAAALPIATGTVTSQESSSDEGLGCSICTDDFEQGQDVRMLPCSHKFHPECVDPWLLNVSGTCPLCRVDLRPVDSRTSQDEADPDTLAPPLQPDQSMSNHRRSVFRDILSLRSRPNATSEERISALRRLREQRRNGSGDVAGSANASTDDVANARRSRRLSTRFSMFGGRRTQEEPPLPAGEASSSITAPAPAHITGTQDAAPSLSTQDTDSNRRT